jgi:perosamine synthetase
MTTSPAVRTIPLCIPDITEEETRLMVEAVMSGWLAHGKHNKDFETKFAEKLGVKYALSLNSCTAALYLGIAAQKIQGEVIMPSFTFVASANAAVTAGAKPVFVDIDYDTCNIDPDAIEAAIGPETEAIMPVHYGGQMAQMDRIMAIAEKHGLAVIEDSAETIGGTWEGKQAGSFGVGAFSFYPTKNMTTGEGGMLTTNDPDLYATAKAIGAHGVRTSTYEREKAEQPWLRAATEPGFNYRLSNVLAALGVTQLAKLDAMNAARQRNAALLSEGLARYADDLDLPVTNPKAEHVWQMYTVKLRDGIDRIAFLKYLRESGIGASVHFDPAVHTQPYYEDKKDMQRFPLAVTEDVVKRIITLPMYPKLSEDDIAYMVEQVGEAIQGAR